LGKGTQQKNILPLASIYLKKERKQETAAEQKVNKVKLKNSTFPKIVSFGIQWFLRF
jgi:hypothetical protein